MGFPLFQADHFPTLFFCVKCNHLQTITFCTAATVNSVRSSQMHVCVETQTQAFILIFNSSPFQGVDSISVYGCREGAWPLLSPGRHDL